MIPSMADPAGRRQLVAKLMRAAQADEFDGCMAAISALIVNEGGDAIDLIFDAYKGTSGFSGTLSIRSSLIAVFRGTDGALEAKQAVADFCSTERAFREKPDEADFALAVAEYSIRRPFSRKQCMSPLTAFLPRKSDHGRAGQVLCLLGDVAIERDLYQIGRLLNYKSYRVSSSAFQCVARYHGIGGFNEWINELTDEQRDQVDEPVRYLHAVLRLQNEIGNGGVPQYWFNSSGDDWKDALSGLVAIGAPEQVDFLKHEIALFGVGGPSEDTAERRRYFDALDSAGIDSPHGECDELWSEREVAVAILGYAVLNKDSVRRAMDLMEEAEKS